MVVCQLAARAALLFFLQCPVLAFALLPLSAPAAPLAPAARSALGEGHPTLVIVEFDATAVDSAARAERSRRHLQWDDPAILTLRAQGYAGVRAQVAAAVAGPDAVGVRDYNHFPLALWRLSSVDALLRLAAHPLVHTVHENTDFHTVSVSDLPFVSQPQTAAEGATGAGTTIAVIDGGLANNYLQYSDFGTCTGVATPASTCRVVYNVDFYPNASTVTGHGTNVSAIALGVAPGAKLAMFDVFNGSNASSADILSALDSAIELQSTYNIVAINMSLGDSSNNTTQCIDSVYASAVGSATSAGIMTVAAAGNSGSKNGLISPACTAGVVSVGAVYDAAYGTTTWNLPGGACTDASAADQVICFSQSAGYLSMLGPGSFVSAPSSAFQASGTSEATAHIAGAVAVLRARYPAEAPSETLQRLQMTGVPDTDSRNGLTIPRLNLLAATNEGTAVSIAGAGPTTAILGTTASYTFTVTNKGPLTATNIRVSDTLPAAASYVSGSSGCTLSGGHVNCTIASLPASASTTITITVSWTGSGPVTNSATLSVDQVNIAPSSAQSVTLAGAAIPTGDTPLPAWAYAVLGVGLVVLMAMPLSQKVAIRDDSEIKREAT